MVCERCLREPLSLGGKACFDLGCDGGDDAVVLSGGLEGRHRFIHQNTLGRVRPVGLEDVDDRGDAEALGALDGGLELNDWGAARIFGLRGTGGRSPNQLRQLIIGALEHQFRHQPDQPGTAIERGRNHRVAALRGVLGCPCRPMPDTWIFGDMRLHRLKPQRSCRLDAVMACGKLEFTRWQPAARDGGAFANSAKYPLCINAIFAN
jgi:hypothetical protein